MQLNSIKPLSKLITGSLLFLFASSSTVVAEETLSYPSENENKNTEELTTQDKGLFRGKRGERGKRGKRGRTGANGTPGATGPQGPQGEPGIASTSIHSSQYLLRLTPYTCNNATMGNYTTDDLFLNYDYGVSFDRTTGLYTITQSGVYKLSLSAILHADDADSTTLNLLRNTNVEIEARFKVYDNLFPGTDFHNMLLSKELRYQQSSGWDPVSPMTLTTITGARFTGSFSILIPIDASEGPVTIGIGFSTRADSLNKISINYTQLELNLMRIDANLPPLP